MEARPWGKKLITPGESSFGRKTDDFKVLGSAAAMIKGGNRQGAIELLKVVGTGLTETSDVARNDLNELAGLLNELGSPTRQFTAYNVSTGWLSQCEYLLKNAGKAIDSVEMGDSSVKVYWKDKRPS